MEITLQILKKEKTPSEEMVRIAYLDVSSPFLSLVGHPLLNAGQLLLQISHLVLVKLRQVVELVFQTLEPKRFGR